MSRARCEERLAEAIARYRPFAIGIVLHWKETLHGAMSAAAAARRLSPHSKIWMGGITASIYAEQLLHAAPYLDAVVCGDAEIPLLRLLQGQEPSSVVNVASRQWGRIDSPCDHWVGDSDFLDGLNFGDLQLIDDLQDYLALLDRRLGVVLPGCRGCWSDCGYCGGSRSAFRVHAKRGSVAVRQASRIVDDLERAYRCGARAFLISQPSKRCEQVVSEIRRRFPGKIDFRVNVEPWDVPSQSLLEAHADLAGSGDEGVSQLLLSIHGAESGAERAKERDLIVEAARQVTTLSDKIWVTIFDGYFCRWHQHERPLYDALRYVLRIRREFTGRQVSVALMAYSTDPGSLWVRDNDQFSCSIDLASISRALLTTERTTDNLLLLRPKGLNAEAASLFMATIDVQDRLHRASPLLWSALLCELGEDRAIGLFQDVAGVLYLFRDGYAYATIPDGDFDLTILSAVANRLRQSSDGEERARFVAELALLLSAAAQARRATARLSSLSLDSVLLVFDQQRVLETQFSFDRLFSKWRASMSIEPDDLQPRSSEVGQFFYTLSPSIGAAFTTDEIEQLARFDGMSPATTVIRSLASDLGAPLAALDRRVADLVAAGVLKSI